LHFVGDGRGWALNTGTRVWGWVAFDRARSAQWIGLAAALLGSATPLAAQDTDSAVGRWSMIAAARAADAGWAKPIGFDVAGLGDAWASGIPYPMRYQPPQPARSARTWQKRARPEVGGRGPNARADWFYYQRAYPLAEVPVGARQQALAEAEKIAEVRGRNKAGSNSPWTLMGPTGFDSRIEPTWGRMSGRVRAMAIDPTNSSRLLLGTATGGVWLSANSGATWTALTDNQPSLAIGAVAFDPGNPATLYAGTGEANGTYYSAGILKSTNSGANWSVLGASVFNRGAISGIAVSPADGNVVVVCARNGKHLPGATTGDDIGGIYRSTDGGQSWARAAANFCTDLAVVATDFNVMYHTATGVGDEGGLYKSIDAGVSWARVTGAVGGADIGRLAIGLSNQGTRVWIGGKIGGQVVIQRSTDSGNSWSEPLLTDIPEGGVDEAIYQLYCESQCDYDNAVAVNPFDVNDVYLGGVGAFRTRDGGATFSQFGSNNAGGGPLHVDHHLVLFDRRANGVVYNGNDGGIYRSADGGATWTSIGGNLSTIQSYHISLHPTNRNIIYTGNQDNGTTRRSDSNVWLELGGGDGGYSAVNHANPQIVYASTTELSLQKSLNAGEDRFQAPLTQVPKVDGEPVGFIAPFVMDPVNPEVLLAGTNRVWRTADGAQTWAPVSEALTRTPDGVITQIAIARSDTSVAYTVASDGSVGRSGPGGFTLVQQAPMPDRYATSVAVHPGDPNTAYVGFSGFDDSTPSTPGHVFKTSNGGASWTNVSSNLPDTPVNALAINPNVPTEIYAGTDVGVFISSNGGGSWAKMNAGLPNAAVASLAVNASTNVLAAATYGRSVWFAELNSSAPSGPQDEPSASRVTLPPPNPAFGSCPGGFFIASVADGPGAGLTPGAFGMELLLDDPGTRVLAGGLNFGGLIDAGQVGFAGFNFTNAANENQLFNLSLTGSPADNAAGSLIARVRIVRPNADNTSTTVFDQVMPLTLAQSATGLIAVPPGFYVASVAVEGAPANLVGAEPEGQFFFSLTTSFVDRPGGGFQGGVVVGGYHATHPFGGVSGFGAFCLATPHSASVRVESAPTYGASGARDLRVRIADPQGGTVIAVPGD
jgi:photosystem II stability/assembly factor-like uncharacterized protein